MKRVASQPVRSLSRLLDVMQPEKLGQALKVHGGHMAKPVISDGKQSLTLCILLAVCLLCVERMSGSRNVPAQFYTLATPDLYALINDPVPLDFSDSTQSLHGTLLFNSKLPEQVLGTGAFKQCLSGQMILYPTPAAGLGSADHHNVALKRPFNPSSNSGKARYAAGSEFNLIMKEAVALQFGYALLSLVHAFIQDHPSFGDSNQPPIPSVRFVLAGVAKTLKTEPSGVDLMSGAFLVEERIPELCGFERFVGNGSAIPIDFDDDTQADTLARFYSFCQHVQWVLTQGMLYCADWQGKVNRIWIDL